MFVISFKWKRKNAVFLYRWNHDTCLNTSNYRHFFTTKCVKKKQQQNIIHFRSIAIGDFFEQIFSVSHQTWNYLSHVLNFINFFLFIPFRCCVLFVHYSLPLLTSFRTACAFWTAIFFVVDDFHFAFSYPNVSERQLKNFVVIFYAFFFFNSSRVSENKEHSEWKAVNILPVLFTVKFPACMCKVKCSNWRKQVKLSRRYFMKTF